MLTRRSKVDPLSDCPLGDGWNVVELDLDGKMSAVSSLTQGEAWTPGSSKRLI